MKAITYQHLNGIKKKKKKSINLPIDNSHVLFGYAVCSYYQRKKSEKKIVQISRIGVCLMTMVMLVVMVVD